MERGVEGLECLTELEIYFQGFKVIWTEVQDFGERVLENMDSRQCESTYHYMCEVNKYCIVDKLRCDGVQNCGFNDNSDELHCES